MSVPEPESFLSEDIHVPWYRSRRFWLWFIWLHVAGGIVILGYVAWWWFFVR